MLSERKLLFKKRKLLFKNKHSLFFKYKPFHDSWTYGKVTPNIKLLNELYTEYALSETLAHSPKSFVYTRKINFPQAVLRRYELKTIDFKRNQYKYFNAQKALSFNFSRNRFFPTIRTLTGETYLFLSLGLFMKFFTKSKSFMKSKAMYLLLASFLRKVLMFSSFKILYLIVKKTPVYLKEMMSTLNDSVVSIYKNPFSGDLVDEKTFHTPFKFSMFFFLNNKAYGKVKVKKKGRLKRKITKRLVLLNRITD